METHHQACCSNRTVKTAKPAVKPTAPILWLPLLLIKGYQYFISPLTGPNCRFYPSCSAYAEEALKTRGLVMGSWLAVKRILSCHPWHSGGYDPVPQPDKTSQS